MTDVDFFKAPKRLIVHKFFQVNPLNTWSLLSYIEYVDDNTEYIRSKFYSNLKILLDASIKYVPEKVKFKINCLKQSDSKMGTTGDRSNKAEGESLNTNELWMLTRLVCEELANGKHESALELSKKLYSMNNSNPDYQYLYGKSLYSLKHYGTGYAILKDSNFVPCLYIFAKDCLELGDEEDSKIKGEAIWKEGEQALFFALRSDEFPKKTNLTRFPDHMPTKASIYYTLCGLNVMMRYMDHAEYYYKQSVEHDHSNWFSSPYWQRVVIDDILAKTRR